MSAWRCLPESLDDSVYTVVQHSGICTVQCIMLRTCRARAISVTNFVWDGYLSTWTNCRSLAIFTENYLEFPNI